MTGSTRRWAFNRRLSRVALRLVGWRVVGAIPEPRKVVLIANPHTSNWDVPLMLFASGVLDVRPQWLVKSELFHGPLGSLLRFLGGMPVDRTRRQNLVAQAVELFARSDELVLVVPPSGTRSRAEHWKSGFYQIALGAKVPIVCGILDYGKKVAGVGLVLEPTGDVRADMDRIRAFYVGVRGKFPELETPIRLREESAAAAPPVGDLSRTGIAS